MSVVGNKGTGVPSFVSQSATSKPIIRSDFPFAASYRRVEISFRKSRGDSTRQNCTLEWSNSIDEELTVRDENPEATAVAPVEENDTGVTKDDLMTVYFVDSDVLALAAPGTMLYEVAERNGVEGISIGCSQGSCGICEVEVKKFSRDAEEAEEDIPGIVVRSCVTPVPRGDYRRIQVSEMLEDPIWGTDGFDT